MKKSECVTALRNAGFTLLRKGKHDIWEKNGVRCMLHAGTKLAPRCAASVRATIHKAERTQR